MSRANSLAHRLYTGDISYDFVGRRKLWYTISAVVLLISALALIIRPLNLGIEFRGGSDFQAPITVTATTVDDVRTAVEQLNLPKNDELTVTTIGGGTVRVQTRALQVPEVTQVKQAIAEVAGIQPDEVAYQLIGVVLIFSTELHHLIIAAISDSFTVIRPGILPASGDAAQFLTTVMAKSFVIAIQLSAPFLVFALVFNIGLGVLSKLMPQMQVFFVAMPVTIGVGFLILLLVISVMMSHYLGSLEGVLGEIAVNRR